MKISATLSWDDELTKEDAKDFFNAIEYVKLLANKEKQMRMNQKTHDILRRLILTAEGQGEIDIGFKDSIIYTLNGIKVYIDNRRPDNEVKIY
ncbi:hypothetical protein KAR91_44640 [Candidatus Pacearchaeota archaeon]|nr:hypothetical protein [Candidatus Pacearchaeota archaeon]